MARRLVERGVRFVQIFLEEQRDSHVDGIQPPSHLSASRQTSRSIAAGSETQRLARQHPRNLGWRVRTDTDFPTLR